MIYDRRGKGLRIGGFCRGLKRFRGRPFHRRSYKVRVVFSDTGMFRFSHKRRNVHLTLGEFSETYPLGPSSGRGPSRLFIEVNDV